MRASQFYCNSNFDVEKIAMGEGFKIMPDIFLLDIFLLEISCWRFLAGDFSPEIFTPEIFRNLSALVTHF
jgi:hypothetical protein